MKRGEGGLCPFSPLHPSLESHIKSQVRNLGTDIDQHGHKSLISTSVHAFECEDRIVAAAPRPGGSVRVRAACADGLAIVRDDGPAQSVVAGVGAIVVHTTTHQHSDSNSAAGLNHSNPVH